MQIEKNVYMFMYVNICLLTRMYREEFVYIDFLYLFECVLTQICESGWKEIDFGDCSHQRLM